MSAGLRNLPGCCWSAAGWKHLHLLPVMQECWCVRTVLQTGIRSWPAWWTRHWLNSKLKSAFSQMIGLLRHCQQAFMGCLSADALPGTTGTALMVQHCAFAKT